MTPIVNFILRSAPVAEVRAWRAAVVAGGESVSNSVVQIVDRMARALMAAGIWDKCYMIDPCVGDTVTASLYRLKVPTGVTRKASTGGFVNADYVESGATGGRTGNGTSKSIDTLINPSSLSLSSSSLMLWGYIRTAASAGTSSVTLGAQNAAVTQATVLGWLNAGSQETVGVACGNATQLAVGSASSLTGFLGGGTSGGRTNQFYRNAVAVGAGVVGTDVFFNGSIYAFATNLNGAAAGFSARAISSLWITQGLSATEIVNLNKIVQTFESALQRNV